MAGNRKRKFFRGLLGDSQRIRHDLPRLRRMLEDKDTELYGHEIDQLLMTLSELRGSEDRRVSDNAFECQRLLFRFKLDPPRRDECLSDADHRLLQNWSALDRLRELGLPT